MPSQKRVFNLWTFTHPLATFVKKRLEHSMKGGRLNAKEDAHHTSTKVDPTVSPSPTKLSSSDCFPIPTHCELKRAQTREQKHEEKRKKTEEHEPPFFTRLCSSKNHASNSTLSADCNDKRRSKQQELEEIFKLNLSIYHTVKL